MRSLLSGLAGLIAVVLLPVALVVGWVASVGTDTDAFVAQMRPVASSPEVREALTERVIDAIQAELALPEPLARELEDPLGELVGVVLQRPEVARAWDSGLRGAHREFVAVMKGDRPANLDATGHVVMPLTIEITGVEQVVRSLGVPVTGGLDLAPEVPITLFSVDDLTTARRVYSVGEAAGSSAPWVVVVLALLALLLARNRVVALVLLGLGGALSAGAFAGAVVLGREASIGVVPDPVGAAVIAAAYRHAEDGLLGAAALALWVSAGLLAMAVIVALTRVILRRRG
ncbi:hypothetical protein OO014_10030 [Intrasporangium calvum]|uniref:Integral membrane protein n=1 Tax=Intrasporangium calvum TaxID=53358 RepID=A0ABT5GH70_9MICO|nr:hypothetical protein [Intrasporangium calvum]MDC5697596.1 hypothetical protein [Intrasporangium calvum]